MGCALFVVSAIFLANQDPPVSPAIGFRAADFTLQDIAGQRQSLSRYNNKKAIVVAFIGNECPLANLYIPTLAEMQQQYAGKGVQFLAVNSNDQDSLTEVVAHARDRKVPFPVLKDPDHVAADALGARRTPEAILLDSDRIIRYRGRIDDQYGYTYRRAAPSHTELKDAIEQILLGKPIAVSQTEVRGCVIGRAKRESTNNSKR